MDILKRQRKIQEEQRALRMAEATKKAQLIAANPKPPIQPIGPSPDISQGIGFGTRRTVFGKGRKRKFKKTIRRSKK